MMKIKKQKIQRSRYNCINSHERALIIQYIEQYKYSTSNVSMITGHNISTIKAIYQVYKREGRVLKKEKRDKILNITSQVLLFMVDDKNQSIVQLGDDAKELKGVKEDDINIRDFKEQMIKQQLINKKCEILSMLNQQAKKNFTAEMERLIDQNNQINEFSIIDPNTIKKFKETQSIKFSIKGEKENFFNILDEQHKLMKN